MQFAAICMSEYTSSSFPIISNPMQMASVAAKTCHERLGDFQWDKNFSLWAKILPSIGNISNSGNVKVLTHSVTHKRTKIASVGRMPIWLQVKSRKLKNFDNKGKNHLQWSDDIALINHSTKELTTKCAEVPVHFFGFPSLPKRLFLRARGRFPLETKHTI